MCLENNLFLTFYVLTHEKQHMEEECSRGPLPVSKHLHSGKRGACSTQIIPQIFQNDHFT